MEDFIRIVGLTLVAGLAMPLGAFLANIENIRSDWLATEFRHLVIAFGGGALFSAVALILVPEACEQLSIVPATSCFVIGGISFMVLDIVLFKLQSPMGQLAAMLSDFIPEALALGAAIACGSHAGWLLAGLMALQNVPEGFNSYREMMESKAFGRWKLIGAFFLLALLGPVCGFVGYYWLSSLPHVVAAIMMLAAGGITYVVFGDIAPQAKLEQHWLPPIGAVLGFALGLVGKMLTG